MVLPFYGKMTCCNIINIFIYSVSYQTILLVNGGKARSLKGYHLVAIDLQEGQRNHKINKINFLLDRVTVLPIHNTTARKNLITSFSRTGPCGARKKLSKVAESYVWNKRLITLVLYKLCRIWNNNSTAPDFLAYQGSGHSLFLPRTAKLCDVGKTPWGLVTHTFNWFW